MRAEYEEKRKKRMRIRRGEIFDWIESVVCALVVCVLVFTFFVRVVGVKGTSMIDTLENGDRIIVSNLFYTPDNGDIVVLRKQSFMEEPIVKRVIATEGQLVSIDFETGEVSVDGIKLDEPYIRLDYLPMKSQDFYAQMNKELGGVVVPENCVFVLGDNRNGSTDSRTEKIGCVDTRFIIGRALFVIYPGIDTDTGRRQIGRIGVIK